MNKCIKKICALLLVFSMLIGMVYVDNTSGEVYANDPGSGWTSPFDYEGNINGVVFGNGKYVAVGNEGTIITSSDGTTWTNRDSGTTAYLYEVTFGNGMFAAVGSGGTILTSPDGITWTIRLTQRSEREINGITYGNGMFVAVGYDQYYREDNFHYGIILTSPDGVKWGIRKSPADNSSYKIKEVSFVNGLFTAFDMTGDELISADGISWTDVSSISLSEQFGNVQPNGITYGNGVYVAVGNGGVIKTSTDGIRWITKSSGTTNQLKAISFGNGIFTAVGYGGTILTSADGTTWTAMTSGTAATITGICYANGRFIAVDFEGRILQWAPGTAAATPTLNKTYAVLSAGQTQQLTAAVAPSNTPLTWAVKSQSGSNVVTVSSTGLLTAQSVGTAVIRVSNSADATKYAECVVRVSVPVTGVSLNKSSTTIGAIQNELLTASLAPANATNKSLIWTVRSQSMSGIVRVGQDGTIKAGNNAGTAVVRATSAEDPTKFAECTVTVTQVGSVVALNKTSTIITVGHSDLIFSTVDGSFRWTVESESTTGMISAPVGPAQGTTVTVNAVGTAVIRATSITDSRFYAECIVTGTTDSIPVTDVILNKTSAVIVTGLTEKLTATIAPTNATDKSVSWTVQSQSAANVATVSSTGVITANNAGTAVIRATSTSNPTRYAECTITVIPPIVGNWVTRNSSTYGNRHEVTYANGKYFALGSYGSIFTSTDGVSWASKSSGMSLATKLIYANGRYVVVGNNGYIMTSEDASTWISRTSGTSNNINSVAYGNGKYVALISLVRGNIIQNEGCGVLISTDGITWTIKNWETKKELSDVIYENGKFIAVGDGGEILTSVDGITWVSQASGTTNNLEAIIYGNGKYVVAGTSGKILTSSNGEVWTSRNLDTQLDVSKVAYGNGKYVAVGESSRFADGENYIIRGLIMTSTDAVNWVKESFDTYYRLTGVTYGNGSFVVVGWNGELLTSQQKAPSSVILNKESSRIPVGMTEQLTALVSGSNNNVTWTVQSQSTANVVTVSSAGLVTANNVGTAVIRAASATDPTQYAQCTITVTPVIPVTSITLNKSTTSILEGKTEKLNATILPSNATNKGLIWTVQSQSASDTITVSQTGLVTAIKEGTAVIRVTSAADPSKYAECTVTVTIPPPPALPATAAYEIIYYVNFNGNGFKITLPGINVPLYYNVYQKSSGKTLAGSPLPISNLIISEPPTDYSNLSDFEVRIYSDQQGTRKIGEYALKNSTQLILKGSEIPVTGVTLNKTSTTIITGKSEQLTAVVAPSNATYNSVTWSIQSQSTANVVTVSSTGLITANKAGTAVVRAASTADPTKYAECSVLITDTMLPATGYYNFISSSQLYIMLEGLNDLVYFNVYKLSTGNTVSSTPYPLSAVNDATMITLPAGDYSNISDLELRIYSDSAGANKIGEYTLKSPSQLILKGSPVTGVALNKTSTAIMVGKSEQLTAAVIPSNATNKAVTWSIQSQSTTNMVFITSTGIVTANREGTAVIRATSMADPTKYADCSVTVIPMAALELSITSVTPNKVSPQTAGTTIRWTGNITGGTNPVYYFRVYKGTTIVASSNGYVANNYFDWTPTEAGSDYRVRLNVKEASADASTYVYKFSDYYTVNPGAAQPLSISSVAPDKASPQTAGTTIRWTGNITGGTNPVYYFRVYKGTAIVASTNGYVTSNTFDWTPTEAGSDYRVRLNVKESDAEASTYIYKYSDYYTVNPGAAQPLSITSVTPDKASPQQAGTKIRWTGNITGGTNPVYYFRVYKGTAIVASSNGYVSNNYFDWTPTEAGSDYRVRLNVKESDAEASTYIYKYSDYYTVNPGAAQPLSITSVTPDKASPQLAGTAIRWTGNITGGENPVYYFRVYKGTTIVASSNGYVANNYFNWTPTEAGSDYRVRVNVKESDAEVATAIYKYSSYYTIESSATLPISITSVTADKASPQLAGTTIRWTSNITGGQAPVYYFRVYKGTTVVASSNGYTSSSKFDWTPTEAGSDYRVRVNVKESDAEVATAIYKYSSYYTINPSAAQPIAITSVTANKVSPQLAGTTITYTANVTGGQNPVYYFRVYKGTTIVASSSGYTASSTFDWTPTEAGSDYRVRVNVKEASAEASTAVYKYSSYYTIN